MLSLPVHTQVYLCAATIDLRKSFDGLSGLVESVFHGPQEVLENYTGTLMADCWSGFESIELSSDVRIVRGACWSHARRKVFEARDRPPSSPPLSTAACRRPIGRAPIAPPARRPRPLPPVARERLQTASKAHGLTTVANPLTMH